MFYYGAEQKRNVPLYTCPHYTDRRFKHAQTVFGKAEESLFYDYSDRLCQWDSYKAKQAKETADKSEAVKNSAEWFELYLSVYCGKSVELKHVLAGVNWSNGYPYLIFGYRFANKK